MSDDETQSPPVPSVAEMGATEVALSPERLAFLRPRLEQLLAEFRLPDAAVDPSLEPAFTPRDGFAEDRDDH